jgi:hypothetical protein
MMVSSRASDGLDYSRGLNEVALSTCIVCEGMTTGGKGSQRIGWSMTLKITPLVTLFGLALLLVGQTSDLQTQQTTMNVS